ncbi:hypothetical protein [Streptomyces sp. NPDC057747]|uniref:hypothetical protein n=1 Tax=Streptomyces sp. NPDC057747 TaxID=3346238 RepID=UPI0036BD3943
MLKFEPSLHAAYLLLTCARDLQSPQQAALALEYISTHHLGNLIDGASARLRDDLAWLEQFTQDGPCLDWRTWLGAQGGDHGCRPRNH